MRGFPGFPPARRTADLGAEGLAHLTDDDRQEVGAKSWPGELAGEEVKGRGALARGRAPPPPSAQARRQVPHRQGHDKLRCKHHGVTDIDDAKAVPSALGEVTAYSIPIDASWFYALGAGASLFVVLQVVRHIFANREEEITYSQWTRISVAMILGFLLLYAAALFHS